MLFLFWVRQEIEREKTPQDTTHQSDIFNIISLL
jgi:hypothetical protein